MGISAGAISKLISEAKKNSPKRKFKQSFDLGISLLLDMSKPENRVDEEVVLPNGRGRQVRVGVIAEGELALQAKKVVDVVIPKKKLEELAKNKKAAKKFVDEIDFFVAQADLMQVIGKTLGPVIGPRGKMPKPV
ncbi:MAG: 50S ribosomal protein L1, partial [Candidatus Hydrothermarchaeaceae archaeon]